MEVACGGGEIPVPHQTLNSVHIGTGFEQVGGKRMTQCVNAARLGDDRTTLGGVEEAMGGVSVEDPRSTAGWCMTGNCLGGLTSALKGARRYARPFERAVSPRSLTSLISTRWPMARAYRCKVRIEGECFGVPDSSLAIADCVVPTRAANSACVKPEAARALSTSSINENSSASSS